MWGSQTFSMVFEDWDGTGVPYSLLHVKEHMLVSPQVALLCASGMSL